MQRRMLSIVIVLELLVTCKVGIGQGNNAPSSTKNNTTSSLSSDGQPNTPEMGTIDKDDLAKMFFKQAFKRRRIEQLDAVKALLRLDQYEKKYKMVLMISEKIFAVIQASRATMESSGYVPGSYFPQENSVRDALSSILENTALISELVLRLPELVRPLLSAHYDWEVLLHWSIRFCTETKLLDSATQKLIHLASQELGIIEPDPDFINPYHKKTTESVPKHAIPETQPKKKRKQIKKGPQLSRHSEL